MNRSKKITVLFIAIAALFANLPLYTEICSIYVQSSDEQFASIKQSFEGLWQSFRANREFTPFQSGRTDESLKREFVNLHRTREHLWTTAGYELASYLMKEDLIRAPGCVAFAYNNTVPYYNSSTICLKDRCCIACEGPRSKDVLAFFRLLASQGVTHLVRLTGSYEAWSKKCHPYWDGWISESNGSAYLNIPTDAGIHSVHAFHMDHWRDHHGVDPNELLSLVLQVREGLKKEKGLLAVHCSAGVGRTGTFLAALAIVDAIENGEAFSIEEIVYRLSLQRIHSVAKASQYITLHKFAESCLKKKDKEI